MAVTIAANCPTLTFEIDFTTLPTAGSRTWTDVSSYVRQLRYQRAGRNSELARTEGGSLSAVLDNRDGRFDPTYTGSPYYPNVERTVWVRVTATWSAVNYRRFTGMVDSWTCDWPGPGSDSIATITASDYFKALNLFSLDGLPLDAATTSQRVLDVFVALGITQYSIASGSGYCAPFSGGGPALSHLLEVEATEAGLLFVEGDGTIVFQDREWRRTNTNSKTSRGTIGDAVIDPILYRNATMLLGDEFLYNSARVTPASGTTETWTNSASINEHFERILSASTLSASQTDALEMAQYLVSRYAAGWVRVPTISLNGRAKSSAWPTILSAVNSERFVFKRTAPGHTISVDVFLERVSEEVIPGTDWKIDFDLSPVLDTTVWLAGDATLSKAGSTTVAAF